MSSIKIYQSVNNTNGRRVHQLGEEAKRRRAFAILTETRLDVRSNKNALFQSFESFHRSGADNKRIQVVPVGATFCIKKLIDEIKCLTKSFSFTTNESDYYD